MGINEKSCLDCATVRDADKRIAELEAKVDRLEKLNKVFMCAALQRSWACDLVKNEFVDAQMFADAAEWRDYSTNEDLRLKTFAALKPVENREDYQ